MNQQMVTLIMTLIMTLILIKNVATEGKKDPPN